MAVDGGEKKKAREGYRCIKHSMLVFRENRNPSFDTMLFYVDLLEGRALDRSSSEYPAPTES